MLGRTPTNSGEQRIQPKNGEGVKSPVIDLLTALAVPGLAALGGAAVVFSEFDDAPGGIPSGFS